MRAILRSVLPLLSHIGCHRECLLAFLPAQFGAMAEYGRIIRVCFVEDLQGLTFPVKFNDVNVPFFKGIYDHAVKNNRTLADMMDICIIK